MEEEASTHASFIVAHKVAKYNKPFSDVEFLKLCMLDVVDQVCQQYRKKFEDVILLRRTVAFHIDKDLTSQLKELVP